MLFSAEAWEEENVECRMGGVPHADLPLWTLPTTQ
jgi:hypothetical protein